jgi:ribose 5-phosphate isomerase B
MRKDLVIAGDHAGYRLKEFLRPMAEEMGWNVTDLGTHGEASVDYPDFAGALAQHIQTHEHALGVLICGTGIGMSIAANRFAHIRAALCHTEFEAEVARAHNHANVLCLGGRVLGDELARRILAVFLKTPFEGGRHQRRIDKIGNFSANGC